MSSVPNAASAAQTSSMVLRPALDLMVWSVTIRDRFTWVPQSERARNMWQMPNVHYHKWWQTHEKLQQWKQHANSGAAGAYAGQRRDGRGARPEFKHRRRRFHVANDTGDSDEDDDDDGPDDHDDFGDAGDGGDDDLADGHADANDMDQAWDDALHLVSSPLEGQQKSADGTGRAHQQSYAAVMGKTREGHTVVVYTPYDTFVYVDWPAHWNPKWSELVVQHLCRKLENGKSFSSSYPNSASKALVYGCVLRRHKFYGMQPDPAHPSQSIAWFPMLLLRFRTLRAKRQCLGWLREPGFWNSVSGFVPVKQRDPAVYQALALHNAQPFHTPELQFRTESWLLEGSWFRMFLTPGAHVPAGACLATERLAGPHIERGELEHKAQGAWRSDDLAAGGFFNAEFQVRRYRDLVPLEVPAAVLSAECFPSPERLQQVAESECPARPLWMCPYNEGLARELQLAAQATRASVPAPMLVAVIDLECFSETGVFPDATHDKDCIIGIGTVLLNTATDQMQWFYHTWRPTDVGQAFDAEQQDAKSTTASSASSASSAATATPEAAPVAPIAPVSVAAARRAKAAQEQKKVVHRDFQPVVCATELEMILAWRDMLVVQHNVDVLSGYNTNTFDYGYVFDRVQLLQRQSPTAASHGLRFAFWGRLFGDVTECWACETTSRAHGDRKPRELISTGRISVDMMEYVTRHMMRRFKMPSLNMVCAEEIKMGKFDLPASEIFRHWEGDAAMRGRIARYCVQDCELVAHLMIKFKVVLNIVFMARICAVSCQHFVSRGQQVRTLSMLAFEVHQMKVAMNDAPVRLPDDFVGGRVFEPHPGVYAHVVTLDYESLYPSIMQYLNLCFSTFVPPGTQYPTAAAVTAVTATKTAAEHVALQHAQLRPLPDMSLDVLRSPASFVGPCACTRQAELPFAARDVVVDPSRHLKYTFAQHFLGIVPRIVTRLKAQRRQMKLLLKQATTPAMKAVFDVSQNGLKIVANSMFGCIGTSDAVGQYSCRAISCSITASGRFAFELARQTVEASIPGSRVIYGDTDSVMVIFPRDSPEVSWLDNAWLKGAAGASAVNAAYHNHPAMKLQLECVFGIMASEKKKRYAARKFKDPGDRTGELLAKGMPLVRRDACNLVSDLYEEVILALLLEESATRAVQCVVQRLEDLVHDRVPFADYVLTRQLRAKYVHDVPQSVVADRMRQRDPASAPRPGQRIAYVICQAPASVTRVCQRAEEAGFAAAHPQQCRIDRSYYVLSQLKKPLTQILKLFVPNPEPLFQQADRLLQHQRAGGGNLESVWRRFGGNPHAHVAPKELTSLAASFLETQPVRVITAENVDQLLPRSMHARAAEEQSRMDATQTPFFARLVRRTQTLASASASAATTTPTTPTTFADAPTLLASTNANSSHISDAELVAAEPQPCLHPPLVVPLLPRTAPRVIAALTTAAAVANKTNKANNANNANKTAVSVQAGGGLERFWTRVARPSSTSSTSAL